MISRDMSRHRHRTIYETTQSPSQQCTFNPIRQKQTRRVRPDAYIGNVLARCPSEGHQIAPVTVIIEECCGTSDVFRFQSPLKFIEPQRSPFIRCRHRSVLPDFSKLLAGVGEFGNKSASGFNLSWDRTVANHHMAHREIRFVLLILPSPRCACRSARRPGLLGMARRALAALQPCQSYREL